MIRPYHTGSVFARALLLCIVFFSSCSRCVECKMAANGATKASSFDVCQRSKQGDLKQESDAAFQDRLYQYREMGYKCK